MPDKIIVQYTDTRIVGKTRVDVDAKLYSLAGHEPYFSVTAETYKKAKNNGWVEASCGCCHEEISRAFPELAPVIALHLSDEDGAPMYCVENAFYWAGGNGRNELTDVGINKSIIRSALRRVNATDEQEKAVFDVLNIGSAPETEWKRWDCTPNAGILAKHLRVEKHVAVTLCENVCKREMTKEEMASFIDCLRPRWKKEAEEAIALLRELAAKKELTGS